MAEYVSENYSYLTDGHAAKKQRTETGYAVASGNMSDPYAVNPSPVVHVRGLLETATENDIVSAVQNFGTISFVMIIARRRMALVEFENLDSAVNLVTYAKTNQIYVAGKQAHFNYSTSDKIKRPNPTEEVPNHVLLLTVQNAKYPINVDVIHAVCSPHGRVVRIVIFRKNGVQAMVEFENVDVATHVKQLIHGCDIYSGCCTLKVEYGRPSILNVVKNDSDSWDYSIVGKDMLAPSKSQPLLGPPQYGAQGMLPPTQNMLQTAAQGMMGPSQGMMGQAQSMMGQAQSMLQQYGAYGNMDMGKKNPVLPQNFMDYAGYPGYESFDPYNKGNILPTPPNLQAMQGMMGGGVSMAIGTVIMVYGLDNQKMNCQRLFNILCLFGNVARIRFLKTKEGSAMAQMGDNESCSRVIANLHGIPLFGKKLQLAFSKQAFVQEVYNPHDLPDGTSAYMDFVGSKNNRFTSRQGLSKHHMHPPSIVLYFFNCPPDLTEEALTKVFIDAGAAAPSKLVIFPPKSDKSSRGLVEFSTKEECIDALVLANHALLPSQGKSPFVLKLAFSQNPIGHGYADHPEYQ